MIFRKTDLIHMGICVSGALKHMTSRKQKHSMEYAYLLKCQYEGNKVVPMGECDNWDYETGCRGHGIVVLLHDYEWEEGNG